MSNELQRERGEVGHVHGMLASADCSPECLQGQLRVSAFDVIGALRRFGVEPGTSCTASGDLAGVNLLAWFVFIRRREVFHGMECEFRLKVIDDVQAPIPQLPSGRLCRGPGWGLLAFARKLCGG